MGKHGIDDLVYSKAREVVYEQMKWTATENTFLSKNEGGDLKFSDCLSAAVKKSAILNVPEEDRDTMLEIAGAPNVGSPPTNASLHLLTVLRLVDCGITEIDRGLRDLRHLKFLNLSGNRMAELPGDHLPRGLNFLELFKNEIRDVRSLFATMPKGLLHVGLARNKLADRSGFESFGKNGELSLRSLDLGDNDIVNLTPLLRALATLSHLSCLSLEGNPCSMCYSYSGAVVKNCPTLRYLDRMDTKSAPCTSDDTQTGSLLFHCFRVSGLENYPDICRYRVDIEIPLFDPVKRLKVMERIMGAEQADDEVLRFASPGLPWSTEIEFPSMRIRVPYFAGLTELRDVFRSIVTVRILLEVGEEHETEALAEFDVSLESIPWWVTSLNYEWVSGMTCASKVPEVRPMECNSPMTFNRTVSQSFQSGEGERRTSGPALKCHVGFGVERM